MRKASTTSMATVMGTTSEKAATPMAGTRTRRISSVAYADDDRLSDAKTARAVGLPRRSWTRFSVARGGPSRRFFARSARARGRSTSRRAGRGSGTGPGRSIGRKVWAMPPAVTAPASTQPQGRARNRQDRAKIAAMLHLRAAGRAPWLGAALGVASVVGLSGVLVPVRDDVTRTSPALLLVLTVVAAGVVGGAAAAVVTAVAAATAFNLVFIVPYWTLKVNAGEYWVALGVFLAVALVIGVLVAAQAERRRAAEAREADLRLLY